MNLRRRLYLYLPLAVVAVFQNLVHEGMHAVLAVLTGEGIQAFRFLTNGWLTSQVIYATPSANRTGAHWLLIALGPSVITVLIGLVVYALRNRLLTRWPPLNLTIWYVGALFLTIDPLYLGGLSWFMQGSDVNAVAVTGWPAWAVRLLALAICAGAIWVVLRWRGEARQHVERFSLVGSAG